MKARPEVSVVTCVYNREDFVSQAVESILSQTYTDFEYVIVDDCSRDNSFAIAKRYASKDSRIVLLRNDVNLGISGAINRAVSAARGDLVMILDSDDLAHPERLAKQVSLLENLPEVGAVGCHLQVVDLQDDVLGVYRPPVEPLRLRWELLFRCAIPIGAGCFRRDALKRAGEMSPSFGISGDYELLTRLALATQLSIVPEVLLSYRHHPTQSTRVNANRTHWEAMIAASNWWHNWLGLEASLGDVGIVYNGLNGGRLAGPAEAERATSLVKELYKRFSAREVLNDEDRAYLVANLDRKLNALRAVEG